MAREFSAGVLEALNRFEEAVREDAWKGAAHPSDVHAIESELESARNELEEFLSQIH